MWSIIVEENNTDQEKIIDPPFPRYGNILTVDQEKITQPTDLLETSKKKGFSMN